MILQDWLDEQVHDAKASEAAHINNAGMRAQLEYLGYTKDQAEILMLRDEGRLAIDHIDGDPSNNKIENLRLVTPKENERFEILRKTGHDTTETVELDRLDEQARLFLEELEGE